MRTNEPAVELDITGIEQLASWRARMLPPVEQLRSNLWSIPVPIRNSPLRYVSVYVLGNDAGLTLIDAGIDGSEAWAALTKGLAGLGASVADVRGCLVTHQHFDHIGLAQKIREASGAWIAMHPADRDIIVRDDFRNAEAAAAADLRWLI